MQIAMSDALGLACWREPRFIEDFSSRDFTWLLVGALLAVAAMWIISRRRRRWF
jgi:LPXTG-motif cell wall-anchored protein